MMIRLHSKNQQSTNSRKETLTHSRAALTPKNRNSFSKNSSLNPTTMENFYNSTGVSSPSRTEITLSHSKGGASSFLKSFALALAMLVVGIGSSWGQVTLLSPTDNGGFETGTTFGANGWVTINATSNFWVCNTGATGFAGSRGAYIASTGTTYGYTTSPDSRTSHLYRDVVVPAGATNISLTFNWRSRGESGWDRLLVYTSATSITPVANQPLSNSTAVTGATLVWTQPTYSATSGSTYTSATVSLPNTLAGTTFRLRFTWQNDGSGGASPGAAIDNVGITYLAGSACTGTPAPGNTVSSSATVAPGSTVNLSLQNATTGSGVTYQWESSTTSSTAGYTNISGATSSTYTATVTANKWYRCKVTCSGSTGTSTATQVTLAHCVPAAATSTSTYFSNFVTTGGSTNISNNTNAFATNGYGNYYATLSASQFATGSLGFSATIVGGTAGIAIFVDWNNDLDFNDAGETVYTSNAYQSNVTTTSSFTIPTGTGIGNYRMRIVTDYNSMNPASCAFASVGRGEMEDYKLSVIAPPSCFAPTLLASSNITSTSSTLSWTAASPAPGSGYDIYYSTSSSAPVAGTTAITTTGAGVVTKNITGLTASTTYYWWVRSNCNGTDKSSWVSGGTFITPCNAASVPWNEGFETLYTNNTGVGGCWTQSSVNGAQLWTANSSATDYNRTPRSGSFNSTLYYSNEDWLFYPVQLTGGTNYTFEVYARQDMATSTDANITLAYGSSASSGTMTTITGPTGIINGNYQSINGTFTPATSGVYYMGIKGFMNGTPYYISIDDISVTVAPACAAQPSALTSSITSSTTATLSWTAASPAPGSGYDIYYATSATAPVAGTAATTTTAAGVVTTNVTALTANTTYYWWVRSNCNGTDFGGWVAGASFYTGYCVPSTLYTGYYISNVVTTNGLTNISNNTGALSSGGYGNFTAQSCSNYANSTITLASTIYYGYGSVYVWVDWNNDLDFADIGEQVLNSGSIYTYTYPHTYTGTFTIPISTASANYRMRIRHDYYSGNNPCGSISYGEAEDYTITVLALDPPTITNVPSTSICGSGQTVVITGTNLTNASVVQINGANVESFTVNSSTQITAITASGNTSGAVSVTTPGGTATGGSVSIYTLPSISSQPTTPASICGGAGTSTTSITASNAASYLWYKNNVAISGSPYSGFTSNTLTITNPSATENNASLTCVVTGSGGCTVTSSAVLLTVGSSPAAPTASNVSICAGETANLVGTSAGNGINWYDAATGGSLINPSLLASGANFAVSPASTTTYYAESATLVPGLTQTSVPFSYSGSIENWTVPNGVFSITVNAKGAQGGSNGGTGGLGASTQGTFAVTPGQVLSILVGQQPPNNYLYAAGGGGTFVANGSNYATSTPLIVAGGGGGATSGNGQGGQVLNVTTTGDGGGPVPGVNGNGAASTSCGGGGGGFYTSGGNDNLTAPTFIGTGGSGYRQGGAGGSGGTSYSTGGFGGGASPNYYGSCNMTAGAGGGYSGGSGQNSGSSLNIGYGGGSYNSGTSQTNTAAVNSGNGQVVITYNTPVAGCVSSSRTPVTVTVNPSPTASAGSALSAICGGQTSAAMGGSVGGAATGGTWSGGTGTWTNDNSPANATYTAAAGESGTITLTLSTTGGGCTAVTATKTIVVNAMPVVNAGSDVSICNGNSTTLAASSPITTYSLTTSGGSYLEEKWVNITTGMNGTGTVVWAQGDGTIGNASGLLTNQQISLSAYSGQTLYLNCYDQYDDDWDGSVYSLSLNGTVVINNGGLSPNDGLNTDASSSWESTAAELETSESFVVPNITFTWTPSTALSATNIANPVANPISTQTYLVSASLNGCTSASDNVVVTVDQPSAVGAVSADQTICAGGTPTDMTIASATGTIQWQRATDAAFTSGLTNVGTNSTTLLNTDAGVGTLNATRYYRAVVTNGVCTSINSNTITITVVADPVISNTSGSYTFCVAPTVDITSSSSGGTGSMSYRWQYNTTGTTFANVVNATPTGVTYSYNQSTQTNNTLSISNLPVGTYSYRFKQNTNILDCAQNGTAITVTIVADPAAPTATKSPNTSAACTGQTITLSNPTDNGGGTGTCNIEFCFSTNGGASYSAWSTTLPSFAASGTDNRIKLRKNCSGTGCDLSPETTYTWTVTPTNTISLSSANNTQTVCSGTAINSITYNTTGATGVSVTGLPSGVSASFSMDVITISGAPNVPAGGTFAYTVNMTGGCTLNQVAPTGTITVTPNVAVNAFSPNTSTRCQGAGAVTYTTTGSNSTGITYSLDAASLTGGNTINSSTGQVTYATGWSGTTTITASAAGCNGPATATHVVTINPSFTAGSINTSGETFCSGGNPVNITSSSAASGGDASITYKWQANGVDISSSNSVSYDPPTGLTTTTTYTRWAKDGSCNTSYSQSTGSWIVTVNQPTINISVNYTSIGNGDYLWNGNTSTDGSVASNWYVLNNNVYSVASAAPTSSTEVFIINYNDASTCVSNTNSANIPASGSFTSGNIYLGSNASMSLGSSSNLNVTGNFINDGTFTPGTGTVNMNGSTSQTIGGASATTFNNLTINNAAGVSLNRAVDVNGTLNLSNGVLSLGDNNLTLGTGGTISVTSPSASKMINTSGLGELRKRYATAAGPNPEEFLFPVGTTGKYTPVLLDFSNVTFGPDAYMRVRVAPNKSSFLSPNLTSYLNRNWIVEPNDISNYTYAINLQYAEGDFVSGGLTDDEIVPIKYSNGQWNQPSGLLQPFPNATNESGSYFASGTSSTNNALQSTRVFGWSGLQTFSEFGGAGQTGQPLPVELVSFTGACEEGIINLTWQTASEFNSSHFDVEKSRDGENWQLLTTLPSAGTSNELITYQSTDKNGTEGNNYFRLRQVDNDGKEKLYDPINVSCSEVTTGYFSSFPNPSGSSFQVIVNNKELIGTCTMNIVDATGKVIEQREIEVKDGINMFVINQELTPGIYFLNISNGSKSTPVLRHAIK